MTRGSRWRRAGWLSGALTLACGGGGEEPAPVVEEVITAPLDGPFEVHEWGLIAASTRDDSARALTAPLTASGGILGQLGNEGSVLHETGGIGKPVLYFHLDEGTDTLDLGVSVRATGSRVMEHFPLGVLSEEGAMLRWPSVRVTRGACRGTYPALTDAVCRTSDGLCEAAEASAYESATADCVQVGGHRGGVLLYRTGPSIAALPLVVRVLDEAGRVSVAPNTRFAPDQLRRSIGWVMRITRGNTRALTRVQVLTPGSDGDVMVPPAGETATDADAGLAHLRTALTDAGLDDAERDAFLAAWSEALFGEAPTDPGPSGFGTLQVPGGSAIPPGGVGYMPPDPRMPRPRPGEGEAGLVGNLGGGGLGFHHALGSVADALIYLLPDNAVNELLPLELTPTPHVVRRVFLARVEIVPVHARMTVGVLSVQGSLSADVARRVLRQRSAALAVCLSSAAPAGTLIAELRILTTGAVDRASIRGLALDAEQNACIVEGLRRAQFPESDTVSQLTVPITVSR